MKKLLLTILTLFFTSSFAFAQKNITITDECVYLDELTASHIPHIKVECGIKTGEERLISRNVIQEHLNNAGIKGKVLNDVIVSREWEKLSYEKVADFIKDEYEKAYPDMQIVIDQLRIADNIYDNKELGMDITCDTSKFGSGYAQVKSGNTKYQIYYYVKGYKTAFVTTERLKAGESLAGKIKQEKVEITNLKNMPVEVAENMAAARSIPAGKILTADIIQEQPALKKGESVKIIASNGILKIETQGVVEENAMPGKSVLVRNLASQKVISANYVGNGIVMAKF